MKLVDDGKVNRRPLTVVLGLNRPRALSIALLDATELGSRKLCRIVIRVGIQVTLEDRVQLASRIARTEPKTPCDVNNFSSLDHVDGVFCPVLGVSLAEMT